MVKMKKVSTANPLYGLVLIGGRSTRMRKDKALLKYHGKSQAIYTYELLLQFCEKVFFSIRPDQTDLKIIQGYPYLSDAAPYLDIGPLGGILSAMKAFPKAAWLALSCDLPFLKSSTLKHLIASRDVKKLATAYQSANDYLPEPLCAIYESHGRKKFNAFFKNSVHCPRKILINSDIELIALKDKIALNNANEPKEYLQALKILKGSLP